MRWTYGNMTHFKNWKILKFFCFKVFFAFFLYLCSYCSYISYIESLFNIPNNNHTKKCIHIENEFIFFDLKNQLLYIRCIYVLIFYIDVFKFKLRVKSNGSLQGRMSIFEHHCINFSTSSWIELHLMLTFFLHFVKRDSYI